MNDFILYLLKASAGLGVFYLFYLFFLRKEQFSQWNRLYLLSSSIFSMLIPILNAPFLYEKKNNLQQFISYSISSEESSMFNQSGNSFNSIDLFSLIYLAGLTFFVLLFLKRIIQLIFLYHRFERVHYHGFKTILMHGDEAPFTFFNLLFLSQADYESNETNEIIAHELAHRNQLHSLDIVLLELLTIVLWFNPFIWLVKLALKNEHEYIADKVVLKMGYDQHKYQKLLFEKSIGINSLLLTSNFNRSLLKNRIKKMTMKNKNSLTKLKYALIFPMVFFVSLLLSGNQNVIAQNDKVYEEADVMPQYPGGEKAMLQHLSKNLKYPEEAIKVEAQGKILVSFLVMEDGSVSNVSIEKNGIQMKDFDLESKEEDFIKKIQLLKKTAYSKLEKESIRVVSELKGFSPGKVDNKAVKVKIKIPVVFSLK